MLLIFEPVIAYGMCQFFITSCLKFCFLVAHFIVKDNSSNDGKGRNEYDQGHLSQAVNDLFNAANDFQYPHEVILDKKVFDASTLKQEPNDDFENIECGIEEDTDDTIEVDTDDEEWVPGDHNEEDNEEDNEEETSHFSFQLVSSASKTTRVKSSRRNLDVKSGVFGCEECDKIFPSQARLKAHAIVHSEVRPFQCRHCSKRFLRLCTLTAHEITHTGEKPFSCKVCDKKFADRSTLAVHHRTHTGERPYGCDECGKRFNNPGHLKRHKRIHSGERPYKCLECSKCFGQQMSLKVHMRTHSGSKPFACDICGKQFIHSSHVNRHKRRYHNDQDC